VRRAVISTEQGKPCSIEIVDIYGDGWEDILETHKPRKIAVPFLLW